jgi:hypothetical protein
MKTEAASNSVHPGLAEGLKPVGAIAAELFDGPQQSSGQRSRLPRGELPRRPRSRSRMDALAHRHRAAATVRSPDRTPRRSSGSSLARRGERRPRQAFVRHAVSASAAWARVPSPSSGTPAKCPGGAKFPYRWRQCLRKVSRAAAVLDSMGHPGHFPAHLNQTSRFRPVPSTSSSDIAHTRASSRSGDGPEQPGTHWHSWSSSCGNTPTW